MDEPRIVYMGTPDFAVGPLRALVRAFPVELVVTRPDRPRGRGRAVSPPPVKEAALDLGLRVVQPPSVAGEDFLDLLREVAPDILVTVAYGKILSGEVLEVPRLAAVNLHASLLPRWRGAAPIHRALMAGDPVTGVTTMHMAKQLDAGDIIYQVEVPISDEDNLESLHDRLSEAGAELLVKTVEDIGRGVAPRTPQDPALVTYARPLSREEEVISWERPSEEVWGLVRALSPRPGATAFHGDRPLKILRARPAEGTGEPGEVLSVGSGSFTVACGRGALEVTEVKPAGKKAMPVAAFINGYQLEVSDRFETPRRGKDND